MDRRPSARIPAPSAQPPRHDLGRLPVRGGGEFVYRRDTMGFRGPGVDPAGITILTLGGSTTNQLYLPEEATWQAVLERSLRQGGHEVVVAAIQCVSVIGTTRRSPFFVCGKVIVLRLMSASAQRKRARSLRRAPVGMAAKTNGGSHMPVDQLLLESDEAAHALAIGRSTFYALDSCVVATRLEAVRFACDPATLLDLHLVRVPLPSWSLDVRSSRAPALRCPAPCPGPPHCSGCAGADSDALHLGHARAVAAARRAGALGQRRGVSAAGDGPAPAGRVASPPAAARVSPSSRSRAGLAGILFALLRDGSCTSRADAIPAP